MKFFSFIIKNHWIDVFIELMATNSKKQIDKEKQKKTIVNYYFSYLSICFCLILQNDIAQLLLLSIGIIFMIFKPKNVTKHDVKATYPAFLAVMIFWLYLGIPFWFAVNF